MKTFKKFAVILALVQLLAAVCLRPAITAKNRAEA